MRCSPAQYLALAAYLALGVDAAALYESPVSIPGYGLVQGKAALNSSAAAYVPNWQNISFFGGIPYGADTSGANRWRDPQPAAPWNGTLDASDFGDICAVDNSQLDAYGMSEDCLSINIWTPATSADEKLPVAIWSYGDGTAPPQTSYSGAGVAGKGIVFVSYNFRNSVLGFLAHPDLTETTGRNASGNWGMLDQFAAVKWVHENIAQFGGDPDHISAIGQSFGAAAVYHMVNSPLTADLGIVNAISESGVRSPRDPQVSNFECGYYNQTYAETLGAEVLAAINVSTIAEARDVDYETIFNATSDFPQIKPVLDYYALPAEYITTWRDGAANKVPYITGNNADEDGASYTLTTTVADYEAWLTQEYGDLAAEFLALYPAANDTQAADSESALVRDQFRVSSWEYMAGFANSSDNVNTYTYYWDYHTAADGSAAHASEIIYALGNLWLQPGINFTAEDFYISDVMSSYWANFMKTGDVNDGGLYSAANSSSSSLPATWAANSADDATTFHVGTAYESIPVAASEAKVALLQKFFAASTPS